MDTKRVRLFILIGTIGILILATSLSVASAATIYVPENGNQTIQQAINNASIGDTIIVRDGTYLENVVVDKSLTIRSENGASSTTVMALDPLGHIFDLKANFVNLSGFTLTRRFGEIPPIIPGGSFAERAGIYTNSGVNNCRITNCNFLNNYYGIYLYRSDSNEIIGNNISYGYYGIYLDFFSNDNLLEENLILNNNFGIYLRSSSNNNILEENIVDSSIGEGIFLESLCSDNTIGQNTISNGEYGIKILDLCNNNTLTQNMISRNSNGIYLDSSNNNTLLGNTLSNNDYNFGVYGTILQDYIQRIDTSNTVDGKPIYFWVNQNNGEIPVDAGYVGIVSSTNITVEGLTLENNGQGVLFVNTDNSVIQNVYASNNLYGVYLEGSENNLIYNNYFENQNNAYDNGNNIYNFEKTEGTNIVGGSFLGGNYWSDYNGEDSDGDGLGNTLIPHISSGGIYNGGDYLPLVMPIHNINTGEDFSTIQDAIDDSGTLDGHIIVIDPGAYFENVDINKRLEIRSSSSVSDSSIETIISASNPDDHVFDVSADYVKISGLKIKNATGQSMAGIYLNGADYCNISSNNVSNNFYGIYLFGSINNIIYNNYFENTNNAYSGEGNSWNTTKREGTNIIGGPYIGGNYWSDYAGEVLDSDGLGDTLIPHNSSGGISDGGDFLPLANIPPNAPDNPSPQNHATDISRDIDLSWSGGTDPNPGDTVTYDVYFGTSQNPPLVSNDQAIKTYDPGTLAYKTKYYWKVVATDNHNSSTASQIWDFTTKNEPSKDSGGSGGGGGIIIAGGGGGGGGGGGFSPPKGNLETDSSGKVTAAITITSSDGSAKLVISEEVTALDKDKKALKSVKISPVTLGGTFAAYNLLPDGATFTPYVNLKVAYEPDDLPEGKTVVIKGYDGSKWTTYDTLVNEKENTVTAKISHFSIFALFLESKEETFKMSSVSTMSFPDPVTVTPVAEEQSPTAQEPEDEEETPVVPWSIILAAVIIIEAIIGLTMYFQERKK